MSYILCCIVKLNAKTKTKIIIRTKCCVGVLHLLRDVFLLTQNRCVWAVWWRCSWVRLSLGVLTNTQIATEPVSNTHKWSAYTVAAVSLISQRPAVTNSLLHHTNDCAIWRSGAIRYLHCEICEGYLFSQIIKVKWGYSASALEPPPMREKVEAAQLATVNVCSSARWTSCCSASCCRGERHRRLLGTEGEKWSDEAHQSITALLARSPHLPVSRTWQTFSEKKKKHESNVRTWWFDWMGCEAMKLRENTARTNPCEVKYVVVYWLHSSDPVLVRLLVLCAAVMLSVNKDKLTSHTPVAKVFQNTLSIY